MSMPGHPRDTQAGEPSGTHLHHCPAAGSPPGASENCSCKKNQRSVTGTAPSPNVALLLPSWNGPHCKSSRASRIPQVRDMLAELPTQSLKIPDQPSRADTTFWLATHHS